MQRSAEDRRDRVAEAVIELERYCLDADAALLERRWDDVEAAFARQEELTSDLAALFRATPERAPANDARVARRISGILAYREDQLRRLGAIHEDTSVRLDAIGNVNRFARSFGKTRIPAQLLDEQY